MCYLYIVMLNIVYYPERECGPVRDYLEHLVVERPEAFARLTVDLEILGAEGLGPDRS